MKKKELKKKYKQLQKSYDVLLCEYVRLKDPRFEGMTNAQILEARSKTQDMAQKIANAISRAFADN